MLICLIIWLIFWKFYYKIKWQVYSFLILNWQWIQQILVLMNIYFCSLACITIESILFAIFYYFRLEKANLHIFKPSFITWMFLFKRIMILLQNYSFNFLLSGAYILLLICSLLFSIFRSFIDSLTCFNIF